MYSASALKAPDVTNEANWHKLVELSELTDFANRLTSLETDLQDLGIRVKALEEEFGVSAAAVYLGKGKRKAKRPCF